MLRAGLPFPLPRCMMCCTVRSVGCAKLGLLFIESAPFHFSSLIRFQKERKKERKKKTRSLVQER